MNKTLEDKIYRVLLEHGQNSKEISKVLIKEIEKLKEKYEKRLEHIQKVQKESDAETRFYLGAKIPELENIIKDLGELLK